MGLLIAIIGGLLVIIGFFAAIFKQKFGNIPRKRSAGVAALGVIVFFTGAIIGAQENKSSAGIANTGSVVKKSSKNEKISQIETEYIQKMVKDDVDTFYSGGKSIFGALVERVQSTAIVKDFEDNEVAALQKYKDKLIGISGTVTGIQAGISDEPFVTLSSGAKFSLNEPNLRFVDSDTSKIAEFKKGSKITAVCKFQGEIAGTALFKECMTNETAQAVFTAGAIESINKGNIKKASDDMTIHDTIGAYTYVLAKTATEFCTENQTIECLQNIDEMGVEQLKAKAAELNIDLKFE